MKEIKLPKSLTKISKQSFLGCYSLEEVDLLHTKVEELGKNAFAGCTSLREMKVPDSLQKFDDNDGGVFENCSKLVPSDINVSDAKAVVTYLRSVQVRKTPALATLPIHKSSNTSPLPPPTFGSQARIPPKTFRKSERPLPVITLP